MRPRCLEVYLAVLTGWGGDKSAKSRRAGRGLGLWAAGLQRQEREITLFLVVQGEDDQYGSVAQVDEVADRCYAPVDVMMLPSCRHAPHFDQTEATLDGIASFCERLRQINA